MTKRALARRPAAVRLRAALEAPLAVPLLVGGLIVGGFVAWTLLARYVLAPWVMVDELQYASVSRSFSSSGHYLFRDHPEAIKSIYPALVSPAWLVGSTHTAYTLMKVINAGLMAAGAIPLYFWARRLVAPLWGALAVVLYLAMPGFMYSAEILTENAYVPTTVLALFAIAVAVERPTLLRQVLALGAIALAVASRLQGLVLFIVLPTAIVLALLLDAVATEPGERRRVVADRAKRFWPSVGGVLLVVLAYVAYESARGVSLSSGLGIYRSVSTAHYSFVPALRWVVYHFGELSFAVALIPLSALIVLFGLACRRATAPGPAERAFLAVAVAAVVWIVAEVGTFASHFSLRVEERYMFNVFPVLFLALAVWLARGLPRPARLTAAAVLAPIALLLALPFESLVSTGAFFTDTFGLIPLYRLNSVFSGGAGDARILVGAGALVAGIAFASLPRRWARFAVPAAVMGFLVLSSASVFAQVTYISRATRHAGGLAGDPSWIDHTVGRNARVEFLYTTDIDVDQHILWQTEFWNRSVRRVFGVTSQDPSIPDVSAPLSAANGSIQPSSLPAGSPDLRPRYVVAAKTVDVAGKRLAEAGLLALYRVRPPLRLATLTSGVTPDGWTSPSASYTRYVGAPRGTHLTVSIGRPPLQGPPPATVTVTVGRLGASNGAPSIAEIWARRTWLLANGKSHQFDFPLRRGPFQVQVTASPPFVPANYGLSDTRTLGVGATFALSR